MILPDGHRHGPAQAGSWALRAWELDELPPAIPERPFSVGLHPWKLQANSLDAELFRLEFLLDKNCPEALGECGLDRACATPWDLQRKAFSAQAELARRRRLPLVLHVVRAFPEILAERRSGDLPGIVHGFHGGAELARELWRHGLRLSFGFSLMTSPKAQTAFRELPAEALLLESDTENRPLEDLYALAASLRGIPVESLAELVGQNLSDGGICWRERG